MQVLDDLRVADVVRKHGANRPDVVAIRCGARALTYAQLDERSSRLAQALLDAGVRSGDRVAHLDRTAPEIVELLFATSKIGAVTVPLNWRLAAAELETIVDDAGCTVLIAGPSYRDTARTIAANVPQQLDVVNVGEDYEERLRTQRADDPGHRAAAGDPAVQMYTSGTTGAPKGVLTTQRNLAAAYLSAHLWAFDSASVSLTPLPMFHIGGIGWAYLGLVSGATTILVSEFDPVHVLDLLEHDRVTNAVFVPTILQMLTAVAGAAERDYSSLRSIAYGASPITTPVLRATLRTFGCPLFGVYGLTETTGGVVQLGPDDHDAEGSRQHLLRSAGRPLPWVEMRIVDPLGGRDCETGDVGEVWLRAPNVMAGYHGRDAETAAALTPEGWLRTGDGGYRDEDGYLFLTDRIKDMIVSGGENIYPVEVEEVLSHHPGVVEVAVIGVPDERWGETVKALVVPAPGAAVDPEELVAFARERLAGYKLPRSVEFVAELPRNPAGKVLKRDLRARYGGPPTPVAAGSGPAET
ncbi:MAG TPA: long-chain-fatty-acid--CoA ligase [Solirubrobacteraceae bacterium]|nr:long-chain-fatty-acid--CoA ligase [Solirubrobacteraceae bacterium]